MSIVSKLRHLLGFNQPKNTTPTKKAILNEDASILSADFGYVVGADHSAHHVFDGLCAHLGLNAATCLCSSKKRTVLRRYFSRRRRGDEVDITSLVIDAMKSAQSQVLHGHDANYRRHMKHAGRAEPLSSTVASPEGLTVIAGLPSRTFYKTPEWRRLRTEAFRYYGGHCMRCGAKPTDGVRLFVVHRRPRAVRPDLAFDLRNLWVLCGECRDGELARSRLAREDALHG
ncbi:MAG: hypothetical protein HQL34_10190 [Alphaproteobacteria bacterium]|nr:hypothetical protein [Alphaproteobacteria bacterium]